MAVTPYRHRVPHLRLTSTGEYASSPALPRGSANDITLMGWGKPEFPFRETTGRTLASLQVGNPTYYARLVRGSSVNPFRWVMKGTTVSKNLNRAPKDWPWNAMNHYVLMYLAATDTSWCYVNGVQVGSVTGSGPLPAGDPTLCIGANEGGGSRWKGLIMDVAVYFRQLFGAEIVAAYNNSLPKSGLVAHYPIAEGSGNTLYDASGNGLHATITGTPTWVTDELA